jgi:hypothetical protein
MQASPNIAAAFGGRAQARGLWLEQDASFSFKSQSKLTYNSSHLLSRLDLKQASMLLEVDC